MTYPLGPSPAAGPPRPVISCCPAETEDPPRAAGSACQHTWEQLGTARPRWSQAAERLWFGGTQQARAAAGPDLAAFDLLVTLDAAVARTEPVAPGPGHWLRPFPDGVLPDGLATLADTIAATIHDGALVLVRCSEGINRSALLTGLVLQRHTTAPAVPVPDHLRQVRHPHVLARASYAALLGGA